MPAERAGTVKALGGSSLISQNNRAEEGLDIGHSAVGITSDGGNMKICRFGQSKVGDGIGDGYHGWSIWRGDNNIASKTVNRAFIGKGASLGKLIGV